MPFDTPSPCKGARRERVRETGGPADRLVAAPLAETEKTKTPPTRERTRNIGPCMLHSPAPLPLWSEIHYALAETGQTIRPEEMAAFALVRRDEAGALCAALAGEVVLEALHISHLWTDESLRGCGLAAELLRIAETQGRDQGARRAHLETRSEAARRFYEKRGYRICGEMKRYLGEQSLYFMEKPLA